MKWRNVKGGRYGWGLASTVSILVYEKRLPHSKNGQWRMAAKHPHTGCMSDPGVTIIVVVVVVVVVVVCSFV